MTIDYLPHDWSLSIKKPDVASLEEMLGLKPIGRVTRPRMIVADKLRIPEINNVVERPRLNELLERTKGQAGATLVCGRAGTGKTVLAAEFSAKHKDPIWYSIEPADTNWEAFSHYLVAALFENTAVLNELADQDADGTIGRAGIAEFLTNCMGRLQRESSGACRLIVLDNVHHLYDAAWFADFFNQLIPSLVPNVHVLMLCRSKPPLPLWRLRSKQMLTVIDESVIGFTPTETTRLCRLRGMSGDVVAQAHRRSGGRLSKLIESLEEISAFSR